MNEVKDISQRTDELDALIAAPRHHKLLFENEKVRVLDTHIAAGETTAVHTHKWPAALYVLNWSDFIRYDSEGNIVLDSKNLPKTTLLSTALWSAPLGPHALKNDGDTGLHIISVEVKT
jgi:hypothetical protein